MAIFEKVRKRDGVRTYYIDFRDRRGRRVRELAGTTRTQARNLLTRRLGEVRAGTFVHPKDLEDERGPTFNEFADRFLKQYGCTKRSNHYETTLRPARYCFKDKPIREITRADLDDYHAHRARQGVGASTIRKNLTALGTLFKMATRWQVIDTNPAADLQKPAEPSHKVVFLTRDEFGRFLKAIPPWIRPIARMAVAQGLRKGEVTGLRWEDVDRQTGLLYINPSSSKTNRPDPVPLTDEARTLLVEADQRRRELGRQLGRVLTYVFVDEEGRDYHGNTRRQRITRLATAAMKSIGRPDCTFHALRHTTASWLVQNGIDLARVQKFMRHKNIQTTLRYAHLQPEHLADTVAALDSVIRGGHPDGHLETGPGVSR